MDGKSFKTHLSAAQDAFVSFVAKTRSQTAGYIHIMKHRVLLIIVTLRLVVTDELF